MLPLAGAYEAAHRGAGEPIRDTACVTHLSRRRHGWHRTGGTADVNRAAVKRRAEEALRRELQPGEHVVAGAAGTCDPSRWGTAALLAAALALAAAGLVSFIGPQPGLLSGGLALPLLILGIQFLPRSMYVAVTDRRLICCRLSRLRSMPRQLAFAVPLADLRIVNYRSGKYGSSVRCEIPGHKRIRLAVGRAGRKDFAGVDMALARSGTFTKLDPPFPGQRAAYLLPHGRELARRAEGQAEAGRLLCDGGDHQSLPLRRHNSDLREVDGLVTA
jgi:hypothetical protein